MSGDATLASSTGDPDDAPLVLRAGDHIGRYRVDAEIGAGAQGIVVRATDLELGRSLAIKVIRNAEPRARERMLREARALAALEHPNVVRVFDVGEPAPARARRGRPDEPAACWTGSRVRGPRGGRQIGPGPRCARPCSQTRRRCAIPFSFGRQES